MPGKEFPLSIILRTVDETSAVLRKVNANLGKMAAKLDGIGKKASKIGKSLSTNLTLPIVAVGVASVKAFADFEDGMASVSTLVTDATESMDEMGKKVLDIGRRTPVALEELTAGLFDVRSASIPAADAMSVLERSAQLGVAGLGTTAQAARLAAGAINTWGLEGKEADRIFNVIFQTTKNGITTIQGLEQGFGAVAKKIQSSGIEADDYFASIAALTTTTLKAAGAHTQMKAAVDGLSKSGKETRKVFRKLGVKDFKELIAKSGSVTDAFRLIAGAAGKQSGALKKLIGSSEGEAAVLALIGSQGDKQIDTLADMRKETVGLTDVQVAFQKKNDTTAASIKKTKNSLTSAAISIGKILVPVVERLATKLQDLSGWWEDLDDDTKETIVTIAGVVAVVGPALVIFGKLVTAIAAVSKAVAFMNAIMLANPVVALTAVIILAVREIINEWQSFEEFFALLWATITGDFEAASEVIGFIVKDLEAAANKVMDIGAVLTGSETSGQRAVREQGEQSDRVIDAALAEADRVSAASDAAFAALVAAPIGGAGGAGAGKSTVEIAIKNLPAGSVVKTVSDDRAVDLSVGAQMEPTF